MHEPELGVDQIEVELQALADLVEDLQAALLTPDAEGATGLDRPEDTYQSLFDPISLRDGAGQVLFGLTVAARHRAGQIQRRAARLGRDALGVVDHGLGGLAGVSGEVGERRPLAPQERTSPAGLVQARQVALENHPVEHGQAAGKPPPVHVLERSHPHASLS